MTIDRINIRFSERPNPINFCERNKKNHVDVGIVSGSWGTERFASSHLIPLTEVLEVVVNFGYYKITVTNITVIQGNPNKR